jgi:predicted nuclease of predicted toxin-antitoxin system
MRFLADMGISLITVAWLREQGHEAVYLPEIGWQRAEDSAILAKARDEGYILLTLDLDFGYLMAISKANLPNVILFRLGNETAEIVTKRLSDVLECCAEMLDQGTFLSVRESTIRITRLPLAGHSETSVE